MTSPASGRGSGAEDEGGTCLETLDKGGCLRGVCDKVVDLESLAVIPSLGMH